MTKKKVLHKSLRKAHRARPATQSRKSSARAAAQYKKDLMDVNVVEKNYDTLFEEKLAAEYREFRNNKEHALQAHKFYRALIIVVIVMLLVLLLLSFG